MVLHVLGMTTLGIACLLVAGVAFERRASARLPLDGFAAVATGGAEPGEAGQSGSLRMNAVFSSLAATLTAADGALGAGDSRAARLLDGALRVARVIDFAGVSPVTHDLEHHIELARTALQNGDRQTAAAVAHEGARLARRAHPREPAARAASLERFWNAIVIDPAGNRVGRAAGVTGDRLAIERGGLNHLLGFVRLRGGETVTVPLERIVFGRPQRIGQTLALELPPVDSP